MTHDTPICATLNVEGTAYPLLPTIEENLLRSFLQEFTEHLYAERVQEDIESGYSNGVEQTPTFFIGVRHEGSQNLEALLTTILKTNTGEM